MIKIRSSHVNGSIRQTIKHVEKFVVGGLHQEDFEWASEQFKELGYVLVAFLLDIDGYHWKAVYVKAGRVEECHKIRYDVTPSPPITLKNHVSAFFSETKLETILSHVGKSSPMSNKALKSPQKVKKSAIDKEC
jgi:hypothetical protein